ncbi:hypothetical protein MFU01_76160 [Myxococcus fulvus]|uniref:Uncharacterized protein n=1 Tax=Myxococcus fulvus TaxID=33 RepID=A0A511TEI3_MYXFU|nr:hypothetical protein MFU01_76160 [Myxococcus fulvus]
MDKARRQACRDVGGHPRRSAREERSDGRGPRGLDGSAGMTRAPCLDSTRCLAPPIPEHETCPLRRRGVSQGNLS